MLLDMWLLSKGWKLGRGVAGGVKDVRTLSRGIYGGVKWIRRFFGGKGGPGSGTGSRILADDEPLPTKRPIGFETPSFKSIENTVAKSDGFLGKLKVLGKAVGRRIPGLNLLFGGLDVLSAVRASSREAKWSGVGGGIGSTVGSIAGGALGSFLGPVGTFVGGYLGDMVGGLLGRNIGRELSKVPWGAIGKGMGGALDRIKSFRSKAGQYISDTVSNIEKRMRPMSTRVSDWFGQMRDRAVDKMTSFRDKVGDIAGGIWSHMAGPLQRAVNGVVGFVNAIIKAINWVASKFGLGTIPLLGGVSLLAGGSGSGSGGSGGSGASTVNLGGHKVSAFAKGVHDWRGGLALVGEEGPELVYLPPHSSVLPNRQTRKLIPGFKDGVGNFFDQVGDVFSLLMKGPKALAQAALNQFAHPPQLPGVLSDLGPALMKWATNGFVSWINKNLPKISLGGGAVANSKQVTGWLLAALQATGAPASWLPGLLKLVGAESGGNPSAVNRQSVGGQHATGLLQMLPSTFAEYSIGGSILNPVANAAAAIRYIEARYGSVYNTPLFKGGPYKGYAKGGVITEPIVGVGLSTHTKYLMGERGPEKITPLHKDTPLTVPAQGGRGPVSVSVGGVTISVTASGGNPDDVVKALRDHADEIADEIAIRIEKTFANLPHQKGA
ncbi:transglycosylase SLT domain-containing protein [Alicyclobacillus kakegawensis]|uniref:transglycosylase SLT domain-containing protein n=1 Tax=Alicyclobacillus kakegawensis TaxID=392012 RepID=UPI0008347C62|nr:transglycosylase SLT domain-containing protein [Alicyclobacillus kakegawensis]